MMNIDFNDVGSWDTFCFSVYQATTTSRKKLGMALLLLGTNPPGSTMFMSTAT